MFSFDINVLYMIFLSAIILREPLDSTLSKPYVNCSQSKAVSGNTHLMFIISLWYVPVEITLKEMTN